MPALTTNTTEGFAATIDVNLDGTTTVTNFSPETTVVPETVPVPAPLIGFGFPAFAVSIAFCLHVVSRLGRR